MNAKVYFHSRTGNTRKVAEAVARGASARALPMEGDPGAVSAELLFLGAAVYAPNDHDIDPVVRRFVSGLDPAKVGRVALFATGFVRTALASMKALLRARGIPVVEESFFCKGKLFVVFNAGHPNRADLAEAERFGARLAK